MKMGRYALVFLGDDFMPKRTYQPKKRRRMRRHGFRARMKSRGGRKVLKNRRKKGRSRLAVKMNNHVKRINWKGHRSKGYRATKRSGGG